MKTKNKISLFILTVISLIITIFSVTSCKKERRTTCENMNEQTRTQVVKPDEPPLVGKSFNNSFKPKNVTILGGTETNVDYILSTYSLSLQTGENPIGLALLYFGSVDTLSLTATTPTAIIVYKEVGDRLWAQMYRNASTGWYEDLNCWGITTRIGYNYIEKQIEMEKLELDNIVILETTSFPVNRYFTDWEVIPLDLLTPDGGIRKCKSKGPCNTQSEGSCDPVTPGVPSNGEVCNGIDPGGLCSVNSTNLILSNYNYTVSNTAIPNLYSVRDQVLRANKLRAKFIDDFYYSSQLIAHDIDLSLALEALNVYQSNLPRKLANIDKSTYADTVIINISERTLLLNLCDKAEKYSTESRYQSIIDTVRANVIRYYNQTGSYLHSKF